MDDGHSIPDLPNCGHCGGLVRITAERQRLIFFVCEKCGTTGAYPKPERLPPR
jgi:hypothetical protein